MLSTEAHLINKRYSGAVETDRTLSWPLAPGVWEMFRQTSWKQWALLASAVLVPLALAAMFAVHQQSQLISEAREGAKRSVVALEQHAANAVDAHTLILRQLDILTHGRTSDQIRNDELLRIVLSEFSRDLTQISGIGITDANGRLVTNSVDPKADGSSVADRDYFLAHKSGAPTGIFISQAFTGRASGQRQFALSIRRTLPSGEFAGVIFTTIPLEHFISFWKGFVPSEGHLIPMVRPDGALIVRYPRTDSPQHLDPRGPFISNLTRSSKGVYTAVSQVDDIERINAYSQVKNYPLYISYSVETHSVLKDWYRQAAAAVSLATVVAGLLAALWIAVVRKSHVERLLAARWEAAARALQSEVSRRERAEESMRAESERVSFGEQLIGIVSHDLRNPLNTISLTAAVMARRDTLSAQDTQFVQRIQNASQRAARLIRDLLDFTQVRLGGRIPVQLQPTNLHELLNDVVAELEAGYPDRIACTWEANDPRGDWDQDRLSQVIENLVLNALKYGAEGRTVQVKTRSDEKCVLLQVRNEGNPLPAGRIADIFKPLQRGAEVSQPNPDRSIGMGLYIVKHIVEAHGGSISVESTPEHGTTFTVTLPRAR